MIKKALLVCIALMVLVFVILVYGPREKVDHSLHFDAQSIASDVDDWLAQKEAQVSDLRPSVHKRVIWQKEKGHKTPFSIVYLHGFSATSEEIRPVPDNVSAKLEANLFYARLTGHGRSGDAMGEASANDWINDFAEAMEIGRRIGEKVIIISTSTGGTLAAVGANDPALSRDLAGIIFLAPNFKVNGVGGILLDLVFVRWWGPLVVGKRYSFEPRNEAVERFWATEYPTNALIPMGNLVREARAQDYRNAAMPALFIYSEKDEVVASSAVASIRDRWSGETQEVILELGPQDDPQFHVITGDIQSPSTTQKVTDIIFEWVLSSDGPIAH